MRTAANGGWLVLLATVGCVAQPRWQGPMPVRNQHPAQLTVMHMAPASTHVVAPGEVAVHVHAAYSSLFLLGSRNSNSWVMDGEYLRTGTSFRTGIADGVELAVELAAAHTSGGFLDSFLIDYHDNFGFPDQGRTINPRNRFLVSAQSSGQDVFVVERSGFDLLDVPIHCTWQVVPAAPHQLGVALRGGVELPTGDANRGYGNSQVDFSGGALLEYQVGGVDFHGHAQHTFAGTPTRSRRVGFEFADVTSIGVAAELPITQDLHAFVQFEWETSTLRRLDVPVATRDQLLLWVGARLRTAERWAIEVGLGEDLQGNASPDFSAWLGVSWLPGGGTATAP